MASVHSGLRAASSEKDVGSSLYDVVAILPEPSVVHVVLALVGIVKSRRRVSVRHGVRERAPDGDWPAILRNCADPGLHVGCFLYA